MDPLNAALSKQGSAELLKFLEEGGGLDDFLDVDGNLDTGLLGEALTNGQLSKLLSMKSLDLGAGGLTHEVSMYIQRVQQGNELPGLLSGLPPAPSLLGMRGMLPVEEEDDDPGLPYAADYQGPPKKVQSTATTGPGSGAGARTTTGPGAGAGPSTAATGPGSKRRGGSGSTAEAAPNTSGHGRGKRAKHVHDDPATTVAPLPPPGLEPFNLLDDPLDAALDGFDNETDAGTITGGDEEAGPADAKKKGGAGGRRGGKSRKRRELMSADDRAMKKMIRMEKNRESAARSRARKQEQLDELEKQVAELEKKNEELEARVGMPQPEKPSEKLATRGLRKTRTLPADLIL